MPTSQQIRTVIDSRRAATMAAVKAKQDAYKRAKGRYFQGLPTHSVRPKNGVDAPADRLDAHPTDQAETWRSQAIIPALTASNIRCDVYQSTTTTPEFPDGHGYVITFEFDTDENGFVETWSTSVNVGPDATRDQPWHKVTPQGGV